MPTEPFGVLDVASEAYGELSVKVCGAVGVLDVASEAYGLLEDMFRCFGCSQ